MQFLVSGVGGEGGGGGGMREGEGGSGVGCRGGGLDQVFEGLHRG